MLDTIRWQIVLVALAGWVNRRPLEVIGVMFHCPIHSLVPSRRRMVEQVRHDHKQQHRYPRSEEPHSN
jgi:hypothetical protein